MFQSNEEDDGLNISLYSLNVHLIVTNVQTPESIILAVMRALLADERSKAKVDLRSRTLNEPCVDNDLTTDHLFVNSTFLLKVN